MEFLLAYISRLSYRRGRDNANADFLSRLPLPSTEEEISGSFALSDLGLSLIRACGYTTLSCPVPGVGLGGLAPSSCPTPGVGQGGSAPSAGYPGLGWATPDERRLPDIPCSDANNTLNRSHHPPLRGSYLGTPPFVRSYRPRGQPSSSLCPTHTKPNNYIGKQRPIAPRLPHGYPQWVCRVRRSSASSECPTPDAGPFRPSVGPLAAYNTASHAPVAPGASKRTAAPTRFQASYMSNLPAFHALFPSLNHHGDTISATKTTISTPRTIIFTTMTTLRFRRSSFWQRICWPGKITGEKICAHS